MEVIVVVAESEYDSIVGVYSSFDKAVAATEAYAAWYGRPSEGFLFTPQWVDVNNTGRSARLKSFYLEEGEVPRWYSYKGQDK